MKMLNPSSKHGPIWHLPLQGEAPPVSVQFLGMNDCDPEYRNVRKLARITVFAFVLSGQGRIQVGAQSHAARQGDVFLLPAGHYHEVSAHPEHPERWRYIWLNISGGWFLRMLEAYRLLSRYVIRDSGAESLFREAVDIAVHRTAEQAQSELQVLLMRMIVRFSDAMRKSGEPFSSAVQTIKQYLDNSILRAFDPAELASRTGLSSRQMNRLFKRETGSTVYSYLLDRKIESAKLMLLDTELPISAIGDRLGYGDPHYFSNLFQSKTGVRPSQFRSLFHEQRPSP